MVMKQFSNFATIDTTKGMNSDSLFYLQDAEMVGKTGVVRSRPPYSTRPAEMYGRITACPPQRIRNRVGAIGYGPLELAPGMSDQSNNGIQMVDITNGDFYNGVGDIQDGADILYDWPIIPYDSSCRVGDEAFFAQGRQIVSWGGGNTSVNVLTATGSATYTLGSDKVTLTGLIAGYASIDDMMEDFLGSYIYLSNADSGTMSVYALPPLRIVGGGNDGSNYFFTVDKNLPESAHSGSNFTYRISSFRPMSWFSGYTGSISVPARCVAGHQGRLFAAYQNTVRYSAVEEDISSSGWLSGADYFDPDSKFEVLPESGSKIVAMVPFNGDLYFFKDRGAAILRGVVANGDPSRLGASVVELSSSLSCQSAQSVQVTPAGIVLWSTDGIYLINGEGLSVISDPVEEHLEFEDPPGISFVLEDHVYFHTNNIASYNDDLEDDADTISVYLAWNYTNGSWQFRTFDSRMAPGSALTTTSDDGEVSVSFPGFFPNTGSQNYIYHFTGENDDEETSSTFTDRPMLSMITMPYTGDKGPFHIRTRNIYTNILSRGPIPFYPLASIWAGVIGGDLSTVLYAKLPKVIPSITAGLGDLDIIMEQMLLNYSVIDDYSISTGQENLIKKNEKSWVKRMLKPYGSRGSSQWSEHLMVFVQNDGYPAGSPYGTPMFFVRGLVADYEESEVSP